MGGMLCQLSQTALSAHYRLTDAGLFLARGYDHTAHFTGNEHQWRNTVSLRYRGVKRDVASDYPFLVHARPRSPENWIRLLEQLTAMPAARRKAAAAALRSAIELVYNRDHSWRS